MAAVLLRFLLFYIYFQFSTARNHTLILTGDSRKSFGLSTFGLLHDGRLSVDIKKFSYKMKENTENTKKENILFGFSLEKTASDGIASYMDTSAQTCVIKESHDSPAELTQFSMVVFEFDLAQKIIIARRPGKDFSHLLITSGKSSQDTQSTPEQNSGEDEQSQEAQTNPIMAGPTEGTKNPTTSPKLTDPPKEPPKNNADKSEKFADKKITAQPDKNGTTASLPVTTKPVTTKPVTTKPNSRRKRAVELVTEVATETPTKLPEINIELKKDGDVYSGQFEVRVINPEEEGLYNLYFHNCYNYDSNAMEVDMTVNIIEVNANNNYLSAGEKPLPTLFGTMGVLFLITSFYWMHILRQNREKTFKIHYMMLLLIVIKSLDLIFNGMNFHFISKDGKPAEPWPILYYIIHLMKGALLFTTIVLIGTGYFFIKHVLSDRDKKIFLIVIPLQVLANTAQIVMDSTEKGQEHYATWKEIFILVDLLCCGAILFPVIWSIRHLQEASQTDGKAAMNLAKLKLFRHYYIMIVCYIYFTRIIVYLLKITVPFQYEWLDEFFMNLATFIFFVVTGYKFRPASDNPYLRVPDDEEDEELEMDEIITTSGAMDGVTRVNHNRSKDDAHAV